MNTQPVQPQPGFNQMNQQPVQPQPGFNQMNQQPVQPKKKSKTPIIIIIVVVVIALIAIGLVFLLNRSKKLVCKSEEGNLTLIYNDEEIIGYTATGRLSYDLDGQKAIAKRIGIEAYMNEFEIWFKTNTTGSCERK